MASKLATLDRYFAVLIVSSSKHGSYKAIFTLLGSFQMSQLYIFARPLIPKNKTKNALPLAPKHTCALHPSDILQFLPCIGHLDGSCTLTIDIYLDKVLATHMGQHNHPRPPITKLRL